MSQNKLQITSEGSYDIAPRLSRLTIMGCTRPLGQSVQGTNAEYSDETGTTVLSRLSIDLNESSELLL